MSCATFVTSSANVTLAPGTHTITCAGTSNCWNLTAGTFTAGTSTIKLTDTSATSKSFIGGSKTYGTVILSIGTALTGMTGNNTFANLTATGTAGKNGTMQTSNATQTITGTLTVSGAAVNARITYQSNTGGTQRTLALGSTGTAVISNVDFVDIAVTGTNTPVSGTSIANAGNNSGITFTGAKTSYWVGNGGNWSDSPTHWASSTNGAPALANFPILQDTAVFDGSSFSSTTQSVVADVIALPGMDWSAVTNNPTFNINLGINIWGTSVVLGPMTLDAGSLKLMNLISRSAISFNPNGATITANAQISVGALAGTVTLGSNFSSSGPLTTAGGNLNANNFNVTALSFASSGAAATTTMGSGTWNVTGTGSVWSITNGAITANSSTILISDTSVTAKTFAGLSKTYNNLSISGGGAGSITFTGANTFASPPQITGGTKSIVWPGSTTTTITGGGDFGNGTNVITMTASAGSATLAFGNRINADYLNLTNIPAATTVPAYAGSNSTNGGGNTNWLFLKAPGAQNLLLGVG